jgi:hypothetical protein
MKKLILIIGLILLGVGFYCINYYTTLFDSKDSAIIVNKSYPFKDHFEDKRTLANAVDNIFIGEVVKEEGTKKYNGKLVTQYTLRITQNIKGGLLDDITVIQPGGYYKEKGKLFLLTYDRSPLLKKNEMYLFAVKSSKEDYFEMIPKYGAVILDNEDAKLKLIKEYREVLNKK